MQTLGTYSSTSNSQNENSLYIGLFGGFRVGVAGHVGGTRGFKKYRFYNVLGTQSSQMQTLGTYSSISNSQNENSLDIERFGGFRVGAAGHVGSTRGFKKYWFYNVLGTQSSQNGDFRYLFLNLQFSE